VHAAEGCTLPFRGGHLNDVIARQRQTGGHHRARADGAPARSPGPGACTLAAYLVGGRLQSLSGTIDLIIVGTAGLILATALLTLRRQASRLALRAEAAYPGSLS
jgi:hypothetical protein